MFSFADRDIVTVYPNTVDGVHVFFLRSSSKAPGVEVTDEGSKRFVDVVAESVRLAELRVIGTGGDVYASERQQWDSGNDAVALEPGVVSTYDRNTQTPTRCYVKPGWRRSHYRRLNPVAATVRPMIRDPVAF